MTQLVSWPMYAVDPVAVTNFWRLMRRVLGGSGFVDLPAFLTEPEDLVTHWRDQHLLVSHTCGFPFATALAGAVRYVATPRFRAPGCEGTFYRSAVVVRRNESAPTLADMAGRRAAFNSRDSQSGYNSLRALVAPLAVHGRFFCDTLETGAHRRSLHAVATGAADLAAIDVVTLALITDQAPEKTANLRVLCHTAPAPGLPLIARAGMSDADLGRLRSAVALACQDTSQEARALRLDGIEVLPPSAYDVILVQRDNAAALGYPELN